MDEFSLKDSELRAYTRPMLTTTLSQLRCPCRKTARSRCLSPLKLQIKTQVPLVSQPDVFEIRMGQLECTQCRAIFPILEGVAVIVEDVHSYLLNHVKGISTRVKVEDLPKAYRNDFKEAQSEIEQEHIEEDLEAERVNSLYLMNHFLRVNPQKSGLPSHWWKPASGPGSPVLDSLVRDYWDRGPFAQIENWLSQRTPRPPALNTIELGCGVGGLSRQLKPYLSAYLGVDGSFASIATARHLALGVPDGSPGKKSPGFKIPGDLLEGPVSRAITIPAETSPSGNVDFIVGDLEALPLLEGRADLCIALNTIDMLDQPQELPKTQYRLLKQEGIAIQSGPYIWHEKVAQQLRQALPKNMKDSAMAVKSLYEKAGFTIRENQDHVPWLFFKHLRQIELYSVHVFMGQKTIQKIP
jgi:SAM-dependent methyltransferase/uncharacterized protein YbaR (Trm112 family)